MKKLLCFFFALLASMAIAVPVYFLTPLRGAVAWSPVGEGGGLFVYETWKTPTTITKNGSNQVSQWNDQTANAGHATQATTGLMPIWTSGTGPNGVDVLTIANKTMNPYGSNSTALLNTGRAHTFCATLKFTGFQNCNEIYNAVDEFGTGGHPPGFCYRNATTTFEFGTDGVHWASTKFTQATNTTSPHKFCFTFNGSTSTTLTNFKFYYDNNTPISAASNAAGWGNGNVLFNYVTAGDVGWDAKALVTGMYLWDHDLGATKIGSFMTYISNNLGY